MMRPLLALGFVLVSSLRPAQAGVVDSPLPAPFTQHVFTVPGVREGGSFATFFACTNLDNANVTVGVELFGFGGGAPYNDAAATSLSTGPGATWIFATSAAVAISSQSQLGGGGMSFGSARILATSKKIACTAYVGDKVNSPPAFVWQLTIIAKTKQKAAN